MEDSQYDIEKTFARLNEAIDPLDSPDLALETCLNVISEPLNAERGFIMLYDPNFDELNVLAVKNLDPETIFTSAEVSMTIINTVSAREMPILSSNALDDRRFSNKSSVVISGLRSVICTPILSDEGFWGLIYIDNRSKVGMFSLRHMRFLEACGLRLGEVIKKILPNQKPRAKK